MFGSSDEWPTESGLCYTEPVALKVVSAGLLIAVTFTACSHHQDQDQGPRSTTGVDVTEHIAVRLLDQLDQARVTMGPLPADDGSPSERVMVERNTGEPLDESWVALESHDRRPQVTPAGDDLILEETACTIMRIGPQQGLRLTAEMSRERTSNRPAPGQHRIVGQPIVVELDAMPPSIGAGCQIPFLVGHGLMPRRPIESPDANQDGLEHHEISFTTMSQTRAVAVVLATELLMTFSLGTNVSQQSSSSARVGALRFVQQGVNGISKSRFREQFPPDPLLGDDPNGLRVKPSLDRRLRDAMLAPPGTSSCWTVDVQAESYLRVALGVAWRVSSVQSRPVDFLIRSGDQVLLEETRRPDQRGWVERRVSLQELQGSRELCFETSSADGPGTIWSLWGTPEITVPREITEDDLPRTIVLVSIDTLRADRLGTYGHPHSTSPVLDQLAQESMVYENHAAQTGWTLPSHVSMLTGLSPEAHGVTGQMDQILDLIDVGFDPDVPTLAAALREAGYSTHGIVSAPYLDPAFGFDRGFDSYDASVASTHIASHRAMTAPQLATLARRTIGSAGRRPLFLFLHFWDVHYDYIPPREDLVAAHPSRGDQDINYDEARHPFTRHIDPALLRLVLTAGQNQPPPEEFYRRIRRLLPTYPRVRDFINLLSDLYDGEIRTVDRHLGLIFEELHRTRRDDSIIVITSDHGESFMEHGTLAHGVDNIHHEGLIVPLIIHAPGRLQPGRERRPSATVDISATILDLLSLERLPQAQGHSVLQLRDAPPLLAVGHDGIFDKVQATQGHLRLLVWGYFGHDELYDIREDPEERIDVGERFPDQRRELRRALALYLLEHGRGIHVAITGNESAEEVSVTLQSDVPLRPAFAYGPPGAGGVSYGTPGPEDPPNTPNQRVIELRASPGDQEIVALTVLVSSDTAVQITARQGSTQVPSDMLLGPDGDPLSSLVSDESWDIPLDTIPESLTEQGRGIMVWRTPAYSVRTPLSPGQDTLEQLRALGYIR